MTNDKRVYRRGGLEADGLRTCSVCRQRLAPDHYRLFHARYLQSWCRVCEARYKRDWKRARAALRLRRSPAPIGDSP